MLENTDHDEDEYDGTNLELNLMLPLCVHDLLIKCHIRIQFEQSIYLNQCYHVYNDISSIP